MILNLIRVFALFLILFLSACVSNSNSAALNFVDSFRMVIASKDVNIGGSARRIGYSTNFSTGTIAFFDVRARLLFDSDDFNKEDTPLTVGGNPSFIFEWTPNDLPEGVYYRLVVVDRANRRLFFMNVVEDSLDGVVTVDHRLINKGDTTITAAGKPVFNDRGRNSTPTISKIKTSVADTITENWEVRSNGRGVWTVKGSKSGEQVNQLVSGQEYTSDGGEIRFTIFENDQDSTGGDTFYFGTIKNKPLALDAEVEAATLIGNRLYIADSEDQEIEVINLKSGEVENTIPLIDPTNNVIVPSSLAANDSKLVMTNLGEGHNIYIVDIDSLSVSTVDMGIKTSRAFFVTDDAQVAHILPAKEKLILRVNVETPALLSSSIAMSVTPTSAAPLDGDEGVDADFIVTTSGATADFVSLDTLARLDTKDNGFPESFASGIVFVDFGAKSNPKIVDVITVDGKTRSEDWVITFEGIVEGTSSSEGVVSGNMLTDSTINFDDAFVFPGDLVVIEPFAPMLTEETQVTSVSGNAIELESAPNVQGVDITFEVRANNEYTIFGSESGFQMARIAEGSSTVSDNTEITLSINPSGLTKPTTRGDFFSLTTDDGVTPLFLDGEFPVDVEVFEGRAYILNRNSSNISIVNIPSLRVQAGIR